jgi:hypothetical protein
VTRERLAVAAILVILLAWNLISDGPAWGWALYAVVVVVLVASLVRFERSQRI